MIHVTLYCGESLHIGDHIRLAVVDIAGPKVKLGVEAPRAVPVHRAELLEPPPADDREGKERGG